VIGASTLEHALDTAALNADRDVTKQLDVRTADLDVAMREAAGEIG
jgi:hypothetical protein